MEARETLGATGRTPGKSLFRPLEDLVKTRNHDSIRADFKKSNEQTMSKIFINFFAFFSSHFFFVVFLV